MATAMPLPSKKRSHSRLMNNGNRVTRFHRILGPLFLLMFLSRHRRHLPAPNRITRLYALMRTCIAGLHPMFLLFNHRNLLHILLIFYQGLNLQHFIEGQHVTGNSVRLHRRYLIPDPRATSNLIRHYYTTASRNITCNVQRPRCPVRRNLRHPRVLLRRSIRIATSGNNHRLCNANLTRQLHILIRTSGRTMLPRSNLRRHVMHQRLQLRRHPIHGTLISPIHRRNNKRTQRRFQHNLTHRYRTRSTLNQRTLYSRISSTTNRHVNLTTTHSNRSRRIVTNKHISSFYLLKTINGS